MFGFVLIFEGLLTLKFMTPKQSVIMSLLRTHTVVQMELSFLIIVIKIV